MIQANEIEYSLCALVLAEDDRLVEAEALGISELWFETARWRQCWQAFRKCGVDGLASSNIIETLRSVGMNEKEIVGVIEELTEGAPLFAKTKWYADQLREAYTRRKLAGIAPQIKEAAESEDLDDALNSLHSMVTDLMGYSSKELEAIEPIADRGVEMLKTQTDATSGAKSGLSHLDEWSGGWRAGDVVVLAARPGVGKSLLGLQMARQVAQTGPVGFFSLEMSKEQLFLRMLAGQTGITADRLRAAKDLPWAQVDLGASEIKLEKLWVDDTPGLVAEEIEAKARLLQNQGGLKMVVIDYLQIMQGIDPGNEYASITENSKAIKRMAKRLKIPILLLSQLSREGEKAGKRPSLTVLRGSGSIEQDADFVMALHRPMVSTGDHPMFTELSILKNRHGRCGRLMLATDLGTQRMVEAEDQKGAADMFDQLLKTSNK